MAVLEVVQLDEAGGRPLSGRGGEGHVTAEVAAVRVERHQPLRWGKLAVIKYSKSVQCLRGKPSLAAYRYVLLSIVFSDT